MKKSTQYILKHLSFTQTLLYVKGHVEKSAPKKIVILTVIGHLVVPHQVKCMKGLKISSKIWLYRNASLAL